MTPFHIIEFIKYLSQFKNILKTRFSQSFIPCVALVVTKVKDNISIALALTYLTILIPAVAPKYTGVTGLLAHDIPPDALLRHSDKELPALLGVLI